MTTPRMLTGGTYFFNFGFISLQECSLIILFVSLIILFVYIIKNPVYIHVKVLLSIVISM